MAFYYHEQIRKYVGAFGKLFANLDVQRVDDNGNVLEKERCPLKYSPKSAFIYKANQDAELDRQPSIKLPHMGFELESIERDSSRSRFATKKIPISTEDGQSFVYAPIPVILTFNLTIAAKTQTELFQIVEQIIPLFDPDLTLNINVVGTNHSFTVPITMQSNSFDDSYENSVGDRRSLTWTLSFSMHAYMFGAANKQDIIRQVLVDFYDTQYPNGVNLQIEPTLGDGTPLEDINADDDWDADVTWTL